MKYEFEYTKYKYSEGATFISQSRPAAGVMGGVCILFGFLSWPFFLVSVALFLWAFWLSPRLEDRAAYNGYKSRVLESLGIPRAEYKRNQAAYDKMIKDEYDKRHSAPVDPYKQSEMRAAIEPKVPDKISAEMIAQWDIEARECQKWHPSFDLDYEILKPNTGDQFLALLKQGYDVTRAYEIVHGVRSLNE